MEFRAGEGGQAIFSGWVLLWAICLADPSQGPLPEPVALKPIQPSVSRPRWADRSPPLEKYITDVHSRSTDVIPRRSMTAIPRSNSGASVDDLRNAGGDEIAVQIEVTPPPPPKPNPPPTVAPQVPPIEEQIPDLPQAVPPIPVESAPEYEDYPPPLTEYEPTPMRRAPERIPTDWGVPEQVMETTVAYQGDGLEGNRQVALTPFPNLNIQSGPLAAHQLPWAQVPPDERPFRFCQTMEFQSLGGFLESNGADDFDYGWYNSMLWSAPFWKEKGIGVQFAATVEPTTFPQILSEVSFGGFRRAIWGDEPSLRVRLMDRLSWGIGFDGVYDSENRVFVGQHRGQLAYSVAPNRELGTWFAVPLGSEVSTIVTGSPIQISTSAYVAFYYRHVWPSQLDGSVFVGTSENPGGFFAGGYVAYRFTAQASWILQGMSNFGPDGGQSLYGGIRFYLYPLDDYSLISGNPQNRYRAFMPAPDHINLQFRKTYPNP